TAGPAPARSPHRSTPAPSPSTPRWASPSPTRSPTTTAPAWTGSASNGRCRPAGPSRSFPRPLLRLPALAPPLVVPAGPEGGVVLQGGLPPPGHVLPQGEIDGLLLGRAAGQPHGLGQRLGVDGAPLHPHPDLPILDEARRPDRPDRGRLRTERRPASTASTGGGGPGLRGGPGRLRRRSGAGSSPDRRPACPTGRRGRARR